MNAVYLHDEPRAWIGAHKSPLPAITVNDRAGTAHLLCVTRWLLHQRQQIARIGNDDAVDAVGGNVRSDDLHGMRHVELFAIVP